MRHLFVNTFVLSIFQTATWKKTIKLVIDKVGRMVWGKGVYNALTMSYSAKYTVKGVN